MKTLLKSANAKINLGLQVLNKRDDGFHNINSLILPISLSDKIEISQSEQYELTCNVCFDIPMEENLVIKAAKLINQRVGQNNYVKIDLHKNIPSGAGLGGGSSDAANVLLAMNEMFDYGLSKSELADIGKVIGSDVPFFIYNQPAVAKGRGEQFDFADIKLQCDVVVVFPNIHVSTSEAYKSLGRSSKKIDEIDFLQAVSNGKASYGKIINDFEPHTIESYPEVADIKNELVKNGAFFALMSGSGSSVFGLFESNTDAEKAAKLFDKYETYVCNTL